MARPKLCFVIGPIGKHKSKQRKHADKLYKKIIRPTFSKHFKAFKVERADHISRPGMIDSQVITHLIDAHLVVADLTTRNANAFYELGIRHLLQKPVIHIYRRGEDIPADIAPYRAIEFTYDTDLDIREAKIALRKAVREVLLPGFYVENPVTRCAGFIRMEKEKERKLRKARRPRKTTVKLRRGRPAEITTHSGRPAKVKIARVQKPPHIEDAPGVAWYITREGWMAEWRASHAAVRRGFSPKALRIWCGPKSELTKFVKAYISDRANTLRNDLHAFEAVDP